MEKKCDRWTNRWVGKEPAIEKVHKEVKIKIRTVNNFFKKIFFPFLG